MIQIRFKLVKRLKMIIWTWLLLNNTMNTIQHNNKIQFLQKNLKFDKIVLCYCVVLCCWFFSVFLKNFRKQHNTIQYNTFFFSFYQFFRQIFLTNFFGTQYNTIHFFFLLPIFSMNLFDGFFRRIFWNTIQYIFFFILPIFSTIFFD